MRTVAFLHQKGGTGKMTLAIATAMALAEQGASVLLLDADVQGTASEWGSRWGERFRVVTRSQIQPIVHGQVSQSPIESSRDRICVRLARSTVRIAVAQ